MTTSPADTAPTPAPRRRRRRHRLLRGLLGIVVVLVILFAIVAVAGQIVLRSDYPRRLVIAKVQQRLGLRFDAEQLHATWLGGATLSKVSVGLPLDQADLLTADTFTLHFTPLPLLAIGRPLEVRLVSLAGPTLYVAQGADGRWNVARAAELLTRLLGKEQAATADTHKDAAIALPEVRVTGAVLHVRDNQGRAAEVTGITFTGRPGGALVWQYDLDAAPFARATGRLSPGGDWRHEVALTLADLGPLLKPWTGRDIAASSVHAGWSGQINSGKVTGTLTLGDSDIGGFKVSGAVGVVAGAGAVSVTGEGVRLRAPGPRLPPLVWTTGRATLTPAGVELGDVTIATAGGYVRLAGRSSLAAGDLTATWTDVALPGEARTSGALKLAIARPWPEQFRADADLRSTGAFAAGSYSTHATFSATGRSPRDATGALAFPELRLTVNRRQLDLSTLAATFAARGSAVSLTSLSAPAPFVATARATADFTTAAWSADLSFTDPATPWEDPATLALKAAGDRDHITLSRFTARTASTRLAATGSYVYRRPKPLDLHVTLRNTPEPAPSGGLALSTTRLVAMLGRSGASESTKAVASTRPAVPDLLAGHIAADVTLDGTVLPLALDLTGGLRADDAAFRGRPLGKIAVNVTGSFTNDRSLVETTELKLLGGNWRFAAEYPASAATTGPSLQPAGAAPVAEVRVGVRDLSVKDAGALLQAPPATGRISAAVHADIPLRHPRLATLAGRFTATDLAYRLTSTTRPTTGASTAASMAAQSITIPKATGELAFAGGTLTVGPVILENGQGRAEVRVSVGAASLAAPVVAATVTDWPIELPSGRLTVSASTSLDVRIAKPVVATGPFKLGAGFASTRHGDLGRFAARGALAGRTINLDALTGNAFKGTLDGSGHLDLDHVDRSTLRADLTGVDLATVAEMFAPSQPVRGTLSARARLARATAARPLEPLALTIDISPKGASFGPAHIGDAHLLAYVSAERAVLDRSSFDFAGGELRLWARTAVHESDVRSVQANVELDKLDLDQVVHAVRPAADRMPGVLSGHITLLGDPDAPRHLYGSGTIDLTHSDLANFDVFTALYAALSAGTPAGAPSGHGSAHLRLERGNLLVENFAYFNRGTEAHATATLADVFKFPDSPLSGTVVGTATPLSQIRLPLFGDADAVLRSLQSTATTLRLGGTLESPKVTPATLANLSQEMREVLIGRTRESD